VKILDVENEEDFLKKLEKLADDYEKQFPNSGIKGPIKVQLDDGTELSWEDEQ
jgi:hypothetical protein